MSTEQQALCRWKIGDHPDAPWLEPDPEVNEGRTSAIAATGPSVYNGTFPANVVRGWPFRPQQALSHATMVGTG